MSRSKIEWDTDVNFKKQKTNAEAISLDLTTAVSDLRHRFGQ